MIVEIKGEDKFVAVIPSTKGVKVHPDIYRRYEAARLEFEAAYVELQLAVLDAPEEVTK